MPSVQLYLSNPVAGSFAILDRKKAAEMIASRHLAPPPIFGKANSWLSPRGMEPGRGWFLLTRQSVSTIFDSSREAFTYTVSFLDGSAGFQHIHQVIPLKAQTLLPGALFDQTGLYLVEFVEHARFNLFGNRYWQAPINKQFNVRRPFFETGVYPAAQCYRHSASSATTTPLTWAQAATEVMGGTLALPFTPDGRPESFRFPGMSQAEAAREFLDRIGCAIVCDHSLTSSLLSLVRIGETDLIFRALQTASQAASKLIFDDQPYRNQYYTVPGNVRVFFHKVRQEYSSERTTTDTVFDMDCVYSVDVATSVGNPTTYHCLWDDLPAFVDNTGTVLAASVTACANRADERKEDYIRILTSGLTQVRQVYSGIIPFKTGSEASGVAWRQLDDGSMVTEIVCNMRTSLGIDPIGKFKDDDAAESSTPMRPRDFRPTVPNYPEKVHYVTINKQTTAAQVNGSYLGTYNDNATDGGACYILLSAGTLPTYSVAASANFTFISRAVGTYNGTSGRLPLFLAVSQLAAASLGNGGYITLGRQDLGTGTKNVDAFTISGDVGLNWNSVDSRLDITTVDGAGNPTATLEDLACDRLYVNSIWAIGATISITGNVTVSGTFSALGTVSISNVVGDVFAINGGGTGQTDTTSDGDTFTIEGGIVTGVTPNSYTTDSFVTGDARTATVVNGRITNIT